MNVYLLWKIAYPLWLGSEVLLLLVTRRRRSSGEARDRGSLLILWPVIFVSIWCCIAYGGSHAPTILHGAHWLVGASLALFVVGVAIRWTAIATLGRSFSVNVAIHATQTVKRTGVFRWVRHPSYTGMMVSFFAVGLETRNWVALAIIVVPPTLALMYRLHVEEAALRDAFGADYADYQRATPKRLIPGIY